MDQNTFVLHPSPSTPPLCDECNITESGVGGRLYPQCVGCENRSAREKFFAQKDDGLQLAVAVERQV